MKTPEARPKIGALDAALKPFRTAPSRRLRFPAIVVIDDSTGERFIIGSNGLEPQHG